MYCSFRIDSVGQISSSTIEKFWNRELEEEYTSKIMLETLKMKSEEKLAIISKAMSEWSIENSMSGSQAFVETLRDKWRNKVDLRNGIDEYVKQIKENIARLLEHHTEPSVDDC
jgi:DNA polymerase III delta prime subunit